MQDGSEIPSWRGEIERVDRQQEGKKEERDWRFNTAVSPAALVIMVASNISEGYYTPVTVNNYEPAANVNPKASVANDLSNSLINLLMSLQIEAKLEPPTS